MHCTYILSLYKLLERVVGWGGGGGGGGVGVEGC